MESIAKLDQGLLICLISIKSIAGFRLSKSMFQFINSEKVIEHLLYMNLILFAFVVAHIFTKNLKREN